MKKEFICWYAYAGHETEGRLDMFEPHIFEAEDIAEAMWKYHESVSCSLKHFYKDLDMYRRKCKHITGWGWNCRELKV